MKFNEVVRAKGGTGERIVDIDELKVPDLWHVVQAMKAEAVVLPADAAMILDVWHLCHDLQKHIKAICDCDRG